MQRRLLARSLAGLVLSLLFLASLRPAADGQEAAGDELSAQVTIRRDHFGVPHILAFTEEAAAFGQGYACAEDHGLALARLFLKARGEEASVFGERFAESDFAIRQFRMLEGAEAGYARMAPWVQRLVDGYAAGYNRYLAQHRADFPEWARPVTGIDVLAHARRVLLMEFTMDFRQLDRIGRGSARLPVATEELRGSNMWAIGKGRSASGKGLLLANPHLSWAGSQLFHEAHLTVPGKVNFLGASLIGTPGLAIGFNEHLGWSHTVNLHDSDDVYELTLDPKDSQRYVYDGRSLPLRREELTIRVRTDAGVVARKKEVAWAHYGPVVRRQGDRAYAFKSASLDEYRFLEQWHRMTRARTLEEFRQVLDMQALPMFNICYADREGNVFYLFNGRFPQRPAGYPWAGVVPGNTSLTEWNTLLPQSRLPALVNPPGGYVQNCNSSPWYTNLRQLLDRRQFPEDLTPNLNSLRQQLSLLLLEGDESITLDEVLRYKNTMRLLLADRVKDDLVKVALTPATDGSRLDEAAAVLHAWDNSAARDSEGALLFVTFWRRYTRLTRTPFAADWDERQPVTTPAGLGDVAAARRALATAAAELKQKYGRLTVPWGEVHRLRRGALDVPVGGLTGEFGAFRILGYEEAKDGKQVARGGDSYVLAVEFTSPPTAYSVLAYSQSDDPRSPHHADQALLFAEEKWKPAWFSEDDLARHLERTYKP